VTQQNAALVEQAAAAAGSLQQQAAHLTEAVQVFKLSKQPALAAPRRSAPMSAQISRASTLRIEA